MALWKGSLNSCPTLGSSGLVNGSLGKGKDRPFDKHLQMTVCFMLTKILFIVLILSSPFQTKPAIDLTTETLKNGFANGPCPLRTTAASFVFTRVNGLLAEVQADWEDRRCFLPSKPLAGTTGFILNLQPNQQKGLFLPIDDVSSRNRFLQSSPSSSRAFPALFRGDSFGCQD